MDYDSLSARLASASKSYKSAVQSRSGETRWDGFDPEMLVGFEEMDVTDDDMREEFPCPFCFEYYDIVGLCCHLDDEHHVEAKIGVCPVCATRVGLDLVAHITLQHGNIFKVQRKKKCRKLGSRSTLSLLRRELREGNLQSLLGGSSSFQSSSAAPDPLLSSFILPVADDYGIGDESRFSAEKMLEKKNVNEDALERIVEETPLSMEDQEEKANRSEFARGLLLSTILDDNL